MSYPPDRKSYISVIPEDLRVFEESDIPLVFDYMEKTFRLHKDWRAEFRQELASVKRGMPVEEFFFDFALRNIDPSLKKILRRRDSVVLAMVRYLVRDKINERKLAANGLKNSYRQNPTQKGPGKG
jgi:hypothetical protein